MLSDFCNFSIQSATKKRTSSEHVQETTEDENMHTLCSRLGNATEVVDKFLTAHSNTSIPDVNQTVLGINDNLDLQLCLVTFAQLRSVSEAQVSNLVEGLEGRRSQRK